MRLIAAAALAALLATPALAQTEARWGSGYGQGIHEANVRNESGAQFSVSCPEGSPTARPGFLLTIDGLRGGESAEDVGAMFMIDSRSYSWRVNRKVLDQNQVVFSWDAVGPEAERELSDLVARLRRGHNVTIAVPTDEIREAFTLAGSSAALSACAGPY